GLQAAEGSRALLPSEQRGFTGFGEVLEPLPPPRQRIAPLNAFPGEESTARRAHARRAVSRVARGWARPRGKPRPREPLARFPLDGGRVFGFRAQPLGQ